MGKGRNCVKRCTRPHNRAAARKLRLHVNLRCFKGALFSGIKRIMSETRTGTWPVPSELTMHVDKRAGRMGSVFLMEDLYQTRQWFSNDSQTECLHVNFRIEFTFYTTPIYVIFMRNRCESHVHIKTYTTRYFST